MQVACVGGQVEGADLIAATTSGCLVICCLKKIIAGTKKC
jgi:hypothetical protein